MLYSVYFNYHSFSRAEKINDIVADHYLSSASDRYLTKYSVPYLFFFIGRIISHLSRTFFKEKPSI